MLKLLTKFFTVWIFHPLRFEYKRKLLFIVYKICHLYGTQAEYHYQDRVDFSSSFLMEIIHIHNQYVCFKKETSITYAR